VGAAKKNESLYTATAFASLTLITLLATPIMRLTRMVPSLASGLSSLGRIDNFLSQHENKVLTTKSRSHIMDTESIPSLKSTHSEVDTPALELEPINLRGDASLVFVQNGSLAWSKDTPPALQRLNFSIQPASLTIVTGPIGSGKTTFLRGILNEIPMSEGRVEVKTSSIAYCDQVPWLTNMSVRANVIRDLPFDRRWYDTVVQACALQTDYDHMVRGDESLVEFESPAELLARPSKFAALCNARAN
jgi:ATP-binding cassette, subfamily C (CFTR/MRP), member 1